MVNPSPIISINKEDFHLLPTKLSVARIFVQKLAALAQQQHQTTHEDLFFLIQSAHLTYFNHELPFSSYDCMRKFISQNRAKIF